MRKKNNLTLLYSDKPATTRVISEHKWLCVSLSFSLEQAFTSRGTLPMVMDGKGGQPQASPAIRGFFRELCYSVCLNITPVLPPGQEQPPHMPARKGRGQALAAEIRQEKSAKLPQS